MWEYKATDYKNDFIRHDGHKYIRKFMKAGKWVYEYPISGKGYYDDSFGKGKQFHMEMQKRALRDEAKSDREMARQLGPKGKELNTSTGITKSAGNYTHAANSKENKANKIQQQLQQDRRDYETKSLAGRASRIKRRVGKFGSKTLSSMGHLINRGAKRTKKRKKSSGIVVTHS